MIQPDHVETIGSHKVEEFCCPGGSIIYVDGMLTSLDFAEALDVLKKHLKRKK